VTTPAPLADERHSITHKFVIGDLRGFMTVGFYDDGRPGEIFCWCNQASPAISGLIDTVCIATSMALRYATPVSKIIQKYKGQTYEPSGRTNHPAIPYALSFPDYMARYLELLDGSVAIPVLADAS